MKHGISPDVRNYIDSTFGGLILSKNVDEEYDLLDSIAINSLKWGSERGAPQKVSEILEP